MDAELFREIQARGNLVVVHARDLPQAKTVLEAQRVCLAIVNPDAPADWVEMLAGSLQALALHIPILAVRHHGIVAPAHWSTLGIGVLRYPYAPSVLSATVDAVLRLVETTH